MAITFSELTKEVHIINDIILTDMICDYGDSAEEEATTIFSRHLLATKHWFSRISYANKKRYILALLEDVHSAWALSLLLKSMWNCRPKDAVLSVSEPNVWSSYDQAPIDHNRTAIPVTVLAQVMKNDRMWFLVQEPESQAMILSELLTIAGGPVMWVVLRRAQFLYERYRNEQLKNLQECVVVNEHQPVERATSPALPNEPRPTKSIMGKAKNVVDKTKSNMQQSKIDQSGKAQVQLEANVAAWNATIKSMKDSLKLEELEMTFNDGTKQKIWKVNRQKPEAIETVDFIQLLPSSVSKRILSFLPRAQLNDYARVNKYWTYLVEEFKAELVARQKIDGDFDKLHDLMLRHDVSLEVLETFDMGQIPLSSGVESTALSMKVKPPPSMRSRGASEKSGAAYSLRNFLNEKLVKPPTVQVQKPIRNMAELTERLERRGAADENLWRWCDNILKHSKQSKKLNKKGTELDGILQLGNAHFPCPMMKHTIDVPLNPPLYKDPATTHLMKSRRNISSMLVSAQTPKDHGIKRYSLWTRDFSGLYPVMKIPSYQPFQ